MNSDIGVIIKQERERQGITRAKLSKNLLSEDNLRALENGEKEEDYFLIKCLAERLGILEKGFSFFLSEKEFEKQNIYEKIEIDILFMNRDEVQDKLAVVYEQLSNSSFLEKVFFYKLALSFENRFNEKNGYCFLKLRNI